VELLLMMPLEAIDRNLPVQVVAATLKEWDTHIIRGGFLSCVLLLVSID
jgi:hypothetical protein